MTGIDALVKHGLTAGSGVPLAAVIHAAVFCNHT